MKKNALFFTVLIFSAFAYAQDTSIDSAFGLNGVVVTSFPNKHLRAKDILVQPDNKILVCGSITSASGSDILLIRYKANGLIDSSYGINGLNTFDFFTQYETALSMKRLSSGNILMGGYGKDSTGNYLMVCKVDAQGKLDSTFGNNGKSILAGIDSIIAIDLQSSGAIIAATQSTMFRLTPAGLLDIGFGTNGFVFLSAVRDMVVQADNKIVLTGGFGAVTKRFLANGVVDIGFASAGTYENFDTTFCANMQGVPQPQRRVMVSSDLTLDSAGGIYVGGIESYQCRTFSSTNAYITKFTSAGHVDSAFKTWKRSQSNSNFYFDGIGGMNVQSNNRLLALSIETAAGSYDYIHLNRILPNGDNDFGFVVNSVFTGSSQDVIAKLGATMQFDSSLIVFSSVDYSMLTQGIKIPHIKLCRYITSVHHNLPRPAFDINKTIGDTSTEFVLVSKTQNVVNLEWSFYPNHVVYKNSSSFSVAPRVKFKYPGTYTVKLKATNQHGSDSIIKTDLITVGLVPVCRFSAERILSDTNNTLQLFDSSLNNPTLREWEINPGSFSFMSGSGKNSQDPVIRFHTFGTYSVKLKVTNAFGKDSLLKTSYITVSSPFTQVRFASNLETADTSTIIQFADQSISTSNITYQWEITPDHAIFLNGTNKQSKNPAVKLTAPGNYSVGLKISNVYGSDSLMKLDFLKIGLKPFTNFYSNVVIGDTSQVFSFTDSSYNLPSLWSWKFNTSEMYYVSGDQLSKNIDVKFKKNGVFSVQLRTCNIYGCDSLLKSNHITTGFKPVAKFGANNITGDTSFVFFFYDSSLNNPQTWQWKFSTVNIVYESGNEYSRHVPVKFINNGLYSVQLRVCNSFGCDSLLKADLINVSTPTGIIDLLTKENRLKIVPNPCSGFVSFLTPQEKINSIRLVDLHGKNCYSKYGIGSGIVEVDLQSEGIKPGIYFVIITTNNGIYRQKLLVLSDL